MSDALLRGCFLPVDVVTLFRLTISFQFNPPASLLPFPRPPRLCILCNCFLLPYSHHDCYVITAAQGCLTRHAGTIPISVFDSHPFLNFHRSLASTTNFNISTDLFHHHHKPAALLATSGSNTPCLNTVLAPFSALVVAFPRILRRD